MSLSSLLQRFRQVAAPGRVAPPEAHHVSPSDVEAARVRARRRLIGMVVLVGAGVIGFPWLFETQPRPMSQDVELVQARGGIDDGLSVARGGAARTASGKVAVAGIVPPPEDAARAEAQPDAGQPREAMSSKPPVTVGEPGEAEQAPKQVDKPAADKTADKARSASKDASARPADKPADKPLAKDPATRPQDNKPATASSSRYVVQFGAFADANAARAARMKVERLGIKTYAQQVDTPAGKRIRVRIGPYSDKADADKALATLRKAGLTGAVLTL